MKLKSLKSTILLCMLFIILSAPAFGAISPKGHIQIAILLDTSNSMDGLIAQAKTKLWKIINEMARARRYGKGPLIEVALFEYGKRTIPLSNGHIRMVAPLSSDLDLISDELFSLTTNGGNEFCGQVILSAVDWLNWSESDMAYKVIFIAGNEPFTQGDIAYQMACKKALHRGITVNTIFCGSYHEGIVTSWKDGAKISFGEYLSINHHQKIDHISTPYDESITRLGKQLNDTYIAYGSKGERYKYRQKKQDDFALNLSKEVMVERSVTKSSKNYQNSNWDLVDAVKEGKVDIDAMGKKTLPPAMKEMDGKEKRAYIDQMAKARKDLKVRIQKLNAQRDKYMKQLNRKNQSGQTLDMAILKAIKSQLRKKNFTFPK